MFTCDAEETAFPCLQNKTYRSWFRIAQCLYVHRGVGIYVWFLIEYLRRFVDTETATEKPTLCVRNDEPNVRTGQLQHPIEILRRLEQPLWRLETLSLGVV